MRINANEGEWAMEINGCPFNQSLPITHHVVKEPEKKYEPFVFMEQRLLFRFQKYQTKRHSGLINYTNNFATGEKGNRKSPHKMHLRRKSFIARPLVSATLEIEFATQFCLERFRFGMKCCPVGVSHLIWFCLFYGPYMF